VLANDHPALRRSLRRLLDNENDLDVVGEAADFDGAVHEVFAQHPDVLVLDLRMPGGFSANRIRWLRALSPGTKIVVTTMHLNEAFATEARRVGAIGFVVADSADRELVEAVRCASRGLAYTSPRISRPVAKASQPPADPTAPSPDPAPSDDARGALRRSSSPGPARS
jgi:DNA-binding NarL/FixJ family response regulator